MTPRMDGIYLDEREIEALNQIEQSELDALVDAAIDQERITGERWWEVKACGAFVASQVTIFESALAEYRSAKAAGKRTTTLTSARLAGHKLVGALGMMKMRLQTELGERQLFEVRAGRWPPLGSTRDLSVTVSYKWRRLPHEDWTSGSITFSHRVEEPRHVRTLGKRKPSAAAQAAALKDELSRSWEHMHNLALYTVLDYLREHRESINIPERFEAKPDPYSGFLNNQSLDFWRTTLAAKN